MKPVDFNKVIKTGQPFTDKLFEPSAKSLFKSESSVDFAEKKHEWNKKYSTWKRIGDMIENVDLFGQEPSSEDVLQGSLGNCYFLSALQALATHPDEIKKIFIT